MICSIKRLPLFSLAICLAIFFAACKNSAPGLTSGEQAGSGGLAGAFSKNGCSNAYYPATPTLKKTYRTTFAGNGLPPSTHTESTTEITSDGFKQVMEFAPTQGKANTADLRVEHGFKCSSEGIAALETASLTSRNDLNYQFKTVRAQGVSFPAESEWKPGKKWQMQFEVEGGANVEKKKASPLGNITTKGTMTMDCEILGAEPITTAAGSFETMKVLMTVTNNLKMNMMGREIPTIHTFKSHVWFAKDVGMVKSTLEDLKSGTELIELKK